MLEKSIVVKGLGESQPSNFFVSFRMTLSFLSVFVATVEAYMQE